MLLLLLLLLSDCNPQPAQPRAYNPGLLAAASAVPLRLVLLVHHALRLLFALEPGSMRNTGVPRHPVPGRHQ
eukprot:COSAG01_NODE_574_length_15291_cov_18.398368_10_plen_72_part_00